MFGDTEKLDLLNKTVLPLVIAEIKELISGLEEASHTAVAVDAPTLVESGFHRECDLVVSVIAPPDKRIERIRARDGISDEKASLRISAQKDDDFYTSASDVTLINDTDDSIFAREASSLIERIKAL